MNWGTPASLLLTLAFSFSGALTLSPVKSLSLSLSLTLSFSLSLCVCVCVCERDAVNKLARSMPAPLFIDSGTLIEQGSNQFFSGSETPESNYSKANPSNDLSLICLFTGTCLLGTRCFLGFLCLLAGLCSLDFHGQLSLGWGKGGGGREREREREIMCVFAFCVQVCLCVSELGVVIGRTMLAHPYRVTY